jgi:hypothetical protein
MPGRSVALQHDLYAYGYQHRQEGFIATQQIFPAGILTLKIPVKRP